MGTNTANKGDRDMLTSDQNQCFTELQDGSFGLYLMARIGYEALDAHMVGCAVQWNQLTHADRLSFMAMALAVVREYDNQRNSSNPDHIVEDKKCQG